MTPFTFTPFTETSDSMAVELAKMLIEQSDSGASQALKDTWASYRKKEVQVELKMSKGFSEPEPQPEIISKEEHPGTDPIKKASTEIERIGSQIVKVQFTEFIGKRKKKVTHIEVTRDELEHMLDESGKPVQVQFTLF